jgi:predicted transcriptional regulator
VHRYYPTTVELEEKITEISQDLDNTKTIINNTVQNLREMTCTKCGAPTWRGWYPNQ